MDGEALRLVERAIARHGGETWSQIEAFELPVVALSGFLPWLKGYPRSFGIPRVVRIEPARVRAVFVDYPRPGEHGVFDRGRVALGDAEPVEHRATFSGRGRRRTWSALDALYFFGYALTHYHSLPWSLRDAEVLAVERTRRSGAAHALTVRFPRTVHTHSEDGLIVRHDYVAEVISPWAHGAHLWREYVEVNGIPIATHRRVLTRIGSRLLPLVALDARLGTPEIRMPISR